jgi:hypothetical protein
MSFWNRHANRKAWSLYVEINLMFVSFFAGGALTGFLVFCDNHAGAPSVLSIVEGKYGIWVVLFCSVFVALYLNWLIAGLHAKKST